MDCSGHGTEVASVAAGRLSGVAKGANILALKILSCSGQGRNSDLIAALDWIATNYKAPGVINLSLGGPSSVTLDMAVESVISRGIPVVVAAGNDGTDACECSPARLSLSMTVGASTQSDERAEFSNFGKCVNIFAPGHMIQVARVGISSPNMIAGGELLAKNHLPKVEEFAISSGTSLAAPAVAGVAALILEQHPTITVPKLWTILRSISQKDSISMASLKGSPNLLLQSLPGAGIDLMALDLEDGSTTEIIDSGTLNADSLGLSPFTWSWILISTLMILGVFGMFALFAGARAVKNASFRKRQSVPMNMTMPGGDSSLNYARGRTLY